ncbi:MAG: nuclease-related domain-containing protein [Proteobacteria bacterium]|nr:nuclease-related domain-containing protein [Pseudomonadota bacterium]
MIRKELDPFESDDKYARAGRAAEEQMAFYLKRFFERKPDIHILNGIRLEQDGDAAQMDHLILHPYGVLIVESKSVQGKIQIKDDGQWIRWYREKQSKGMASPHSRSRAAACLCSPRKIQRRSCSF